MRLAGRRGRRHLSVARRARAAAHDLALATRATKDAALQAMADALVPATDAGPGRERQRRRARAEAAGTPEALHRPAAARRPPGSPAMADGLRQVAGLPDPVGEVVRGSTLANGLELRQVRVPFGVVGIIYEARPNVTADAAGICLKSGNAVLLRGSSSALRSNTAIVAVLRDAAAAARAARGRGAAGARATATSSVKALMRARGLVDVLIPRGGAGLIRSVVEESTVPVIETGVGNCHVYVDAAADLDMALAHRDQRQDPAARRSATPPSRCWCTRDVADEFLPRVVAALQDAGVTVHGDAAFAAYDGVRAGHRGRLRRRVPLARHRRRRRRPTWTTAIAHIRALLHRAHRRDRHPTRRARPAGSPPRSTPPPCWSTPPPGSPTAASSGSAPRSASRPRSCTPAARWGCRR